MYTQKHLEDKHFCERMFDVSVICNNIQCSSCKYAVRTPLERSISNISPDGKSKFKYNSIYVCGLKMNEECKNFSPCRGEEGE